MFIKNLETLFIVIIALALSLLGYNYYRSYTFKHNPLPANYIHKIKLQEKNILKNMKKKFGVVYQFPLIITDKIPGRLYGLTSYKNGKITIYLNKKVMKESFSYILNNVIAHEYAHALLFALHYDIDEKDGHSKLWQATCTKLGGKDCRQYVDQHEIVMSKIYF